MPRRKKPHPFAKAIGHRIRELRTEAGLTMEKLAFETDTSKGHLSSMERGLVMPTVATLAVLAERLGVLVADVVNDPDGGDRARLLELSRRLGPGPLRKLVRDLTSVTRSKPSRPR